MFIDDSESLPVLLELNYRLVHSSLNRIGLKSGNLLVLRLCQYYHNQIIVGRVKLAMYR